MSTSSSVNGTDTAWRSLIFQVRTCHTYHLPPPPSSLPSLSSLSSLSLLSLSLFLSLPSLYSLSLLPKGHRDFVKKTYTAATMADYALLVVAGGSGEYEAGIAIGGQTREHILLSFVMGLSRFVKQQSTNQTSFIQGANSLTDVDKDWWLLFPNSKNSHQLKPRRDSRKS